MTEVPPRCIVAREDEAIVLVDVDAPGPPAPRRLDREQWHRVARAAGSRTRWIWNDTRRWYPELLAAGITVGRCHDLRLGHAILRDPSERPGERSGPDEEWDVDSAAAPAAAAPTLFDHDGLFDLDGPPARPGLPEHLAGVASEYARQQQRIASASDPGSLQLLLAAESAGALLAVELHTAGLPWDRAVHESILEALLGSRPPLGTHPARVEELALQVRAALGDPAASLDSRPKLLRALHRVGVTARSTSRWELAQYDHPAIAPLLAYKKLTRLASANGWAWLDEWAADGRFRPVYVPGGVVTGRWASSGGGALQLPRQLRPAVRADPGWVLVVADVAGLEPRVLAAMARDEALAAAARGTDLYEGIVADGVVQTRQEAKIALLGAMYGATTGDSGRLVPALRRAFPRAMALVDEAAHTGERGAVVATWLGRTCPPPSPAWREVQGRAGAPDATEADRSRARRSARDRGRFTRNFVVQGTAAEWALAWLADVRNRLAAFAAVAPSAAAPRSGAVFGQRAHLAFFLHDEVIVHAPASQADAAVEAVRDAAASAGRLLFGDFPLDFPLSVRVAVDAAKD